MAPHLYGMTLKNSRVCVFSMYDCMLYNQEAIDTQGYLLRSGMRLHLHYKNGELSQFYRRHPVDSKINTHGNARGLENSFSLQLMIVDK